MKNKIILILSLVSMSLQAQKVSFISEELMMGVKNHLGFADADEVFQTQTDTITAINLSGLGICDISDLASLQNVSWIDLSDNNIEDVSPLTSLEHLHYVNLKRNKLETINPLIYACTDSLYVNVADNYIKDYKYLFSVTSCPLLIEGMGAQKEEMNPIYFDVYQLYADVDDSGEMKVSWRGYTNMEDDVFLKCGAWNVLAMMDGYTNSVLLPHELDTISQIILSNGIVGDTTYVIPSAHLNIESNQTTILETGLPDSYQIGFYNALYGTVTVIDQSFTYTAPSTQQTDTLYFSYYQGQQLKGFAEYYFGMASSEPSEVTQISSSSKQLKLTWSGDRLMVECPLSISSDCDLATITVWDAEGKLLTTKEVYADNDICVELKVSGSIGNVVIVQVDYCGKRIIGKCFKTK